MLHEFIICPMCATCQPISSSTSPLRYLVNSTKRDATSCNFLHPLVPLLCSSTVLSSVLSYTLVLCSFLRVRDQVSHPYTRTRKFIVGCVVIFTCLDLRPSVLLRGVGCYQHTLRNNGEGRRCQQNRGVSLTTRFAFLDNRREQTRF